MTIDTTTDLARRIRDDLVHGYHPKIEDLREFWCELTGEHIQSGIRCEACGGGGLVSATKYVPPFPEPVDTVKCVSCDGTGWWCRPTSMLDQEAT